MELMLAVSLVGILCGMGLTLWVMLKGNDADTIVGCSAFSIDLLCLVGLEC